MYLHYRKIAKSQHLAKLVYDLPDLITTIRLSSISRLFSHWYTCLMSSLQLYRCQLVRPYTGPSLQSMRILRSLVLSIQMLKVHPDGARGRVWRLLDFAVTRDTEYNPRTTATYPDYLPTCNSLLHTPSSVPIPNLAL